MIPPPHPQSIMLPHTVGRAPARRQAEGCCGGATRAFGSPADLAGLHGALDHRDELREQARFLMSEDQPEPRLSRSERAWRYDALVWAEEKNAKLSVHIDKDGYDDTMEEEAYPGVLAKLLKAAEIKLADRDTALGVGNGSGNLFVYGDYASIKVAQAIIISGDKAKQELALAKDKIDLLWNSADADARISCQRLQRKGEGQAIEGGRVTPDCPGCKMMWDNCQCPEPVEGQEKL